MWSLTSSAYGNVAHRYNRNIKGAALQDSHLEEQIPNTNPQAIEPTQWQQILVYRYKVAFYSHFLTLLLNTNVIKHTCLDTTIVLYVVTYLKQW